MKIGLDWETLKKPVDWKDIFSRQNKVDVVIGYGNGKFMAQKAEEHEGRNYFGIDYSEKSFKKASRFLKEENLDNARVVCMEAKAAFLILIPEKSISHIYINFPDPWPKTKHHKNRLLDKEFLKIAASRCKSDGEFIIATDDPFYRDFILEEVGAVHLWKSLFQKGYTDELSNYPTTKYEKKWRNRGKDIYYMVLQKKAEPDEYYSIDEYEIDDVVIENFDVSKLKDLRGQTIKDELSVAKVLKLDEKNDKVELLVLLKDDTLFRKKNLELHNCSPDKWKLEIPDNLYKSYSLKLFTDKLKRLYK